MSSLIEQMGHSVVAHYFKYDDYSITVMNIPGLTCTRSTNAFLPPLNIQKLEIIHFGLTLKCQTLYQSPTSHTVSFNSSQQHYTEKCSRKFKCFTSGSLKAEQISNSAPLCTATLLYDNATMKKNSQPPVN